MNRKQELIDHHCAKNTMRSRVNANCISCIYDHGSVGTWRGQVKACTVTSCAIYPIRVGADKPKRERTAAQKANTEKLAVLRRERIRNKGLS